MAARYDLDFKNPDSPESMKKTADELIDYYKDLLLLLTNGVSLYIAPYRDPYRVYILL